ncbi:hypothetical protein HID58_096395 [Brassica napus]|uniref:Pentatricopeptide repeat-containing protein n=1 Tax=Brassica napus TaxID=3708 RepID=A0ABQ7X0J5_BRANA|nr:hypothetical protein HID58_096395 [Brassica napus]
MKKTALSPNATLTLTPPRSRACAETKNLKAGKAVHCHLIRCLQNSSRVVHNSLLNMYVSCLNHPPPGSERRDTLRRCRQFGIMMRMEIKPSPLGDEYVKDLFVVSSAISMYAELGDIEGSRRVFDSCVERNIEVWNTMIGVYVQNEYLVESIDLFLDAIGSKEIVSDEKAGVKIDYITVTALLSAASNLRNKEIGKQTHGFLIRQGIQFEGMNSYLIDMYAKSGLIRISEKLFERSGYAERDQATWNSMMSGYTQNGHTEETFAVFRKMLEQNIKPNAITVASILPACSQIGSFDLGAIQYAENMFYQTKERNSVTYTTMILGYGQHGMGERAISLFRSMEESGVKPDAVTFVAVLSACSYSGLVDEGLKIFEEMSEVYNIQPSNEHYCCVTDMLGRVGRVDEAYEFVKGLGEEGNIAELWGSVLGACRVHGEIELAETVSEKLAKVDKGKNFSGYQVLLSNMYAEEQNGRVLIDQEHPQSDEIYDVIEGLAKDMRGDSYLTTFPMVTPSLELEE